MSRRALWSVLVFTVFAFATMVLFFWIKEGNLRDAGAEMDRTLSNIGHEAKQTTGEVLTGTKNAVKDATDGDDRT